ncbi:hypothetical protein DDSR119_63 [Pseudomonas phage DDSR119]|nr:hypothetical protein DDSR119_63 [Pseudomonas phage DDSR119]
MSIALTRSQEFLVKHLKDWPDDYGSVCCIGMTERAGRAEVRSIRFARREFAFTDDKLVETTSLTTDSDLHSWRPHLSRFMVSRGEFLLAQALYVARQERPEDPAKEQAEAYPAYWRQLPDNWRYMDTYRVNKLFPLDSIDPSGALTHARKKLLVCGARTGGKSVRKDLEEAVSTIQCYLRDN